VVAACGHMAGPLKKAEVNPAKRRKRGGWAGGKETTRPPGEKRGGTSQT